MLCISLSFSLNAYRNFPTGLWISACVSCLPMHLHFLAMQSRRLYLFKQRAAFLPLLLNPYSKGPLIPNPMREGQPNHNIAPIQLLYLLALNQNTRSSQSACAGKHISQAVWSNSHDLGKKTIGALIVGAWHVLRQTWSSLWMEEPGLLAYGNELQFFNFF